MTQEDAEAGRARGLVPGQVCYLQMPAADAGPMIWIRLADLDETLGQVTRHGGGITDPPSPDGPDRTLATIVDPEGNAIGLASHQDS